MDDDTTDTTPTDPVDPPPADPEGDALALLRADAADTTAKREHKAETSDALAAAQHADDAAAAEQSAAEGKQNADLDNAVALLNRKYRIGTPPAMSRTLRT